MKPAFMASLEVAGKQVRMAIAHGLKNARKLAEEVKAGKCNYDIIEVMACPGGCVGGAGQPVNFLPAPSNVAPKACMKPTRCCGCAKAQENPYIIETYEKVLDKPGNHKAHHAAHQIPVTPAYFRQGHAADDVKGTDKLSIKVCVGTNCYLKGSQSILKALTKDIGAACRMRSIFQATFCFEKCGQAPNVMIGDQLISKCTFDKAREALNAELKKEDLLNHVYRGGDPVCGAAARFPILESLYFARTGDIFLPPVRTFSPAESRSAEMGISISDLAGIQPSALTWNTDTVQIRLLNPAIKRVQEKASGALQSSGGKRREIAVRMGFVAM